MNPESQNSENCSTFPCVSFFKKLKRSTSDRWLAGVCGGFSKSTEIPVWVFRVFFLFSTFVTGIGILLYILLWVFMPLEESLN
ncbi:MAG: PspC domain-containing protein [Candidatus Margulisiibacteriota bacterium]|jgi:phage shock protein PspC (stress-responsive transcriptional regulator)